MIRIHEELSVVRTLRLLRDYDILYKETPWYRFIKRRKIAEKHDDLMRKFMYFATNHYLESLGIKDTFTYNK